MVNGCCCFTSPKNWKASPFPRLFKCCVFEIFFISVYSLRVFSTSQLANKSSSKPPLTLHQKTVTTRCDLSFVKLLEVLEVLWTFLNFWIIQTPWKGWYCKDACGEELFQKDFLTKIQYIFLTKPYSLMPFHENTWKSGTILRIWQFTLQRLTSDIFIYDDILGGKQRKTCMELLGLTVTIDSMHQRLFQLTSTTASTLSAFNCLDLEIISALFAGLCSSFLIENNQRLF